MQRLDVAVQRALSGFLTDDEFKPSAQRVDETVAAMDDDEIDALYRELVASGYDLTPVEFVASAMRREAALAFNLD